jgi:uncharacterized protein YfaT (DUF1175 family)
MAGDEHQAQQVVADVVVRETVRIVAHGVSVQFEFDAVFVLAAGVQGALAQMVDGPPLRRGHQPCGGVVRHAVDGPALQRDDQHVLRQFLGDADIAGHARHARHQLRGFHAPERVERALEAGVGHRRR